jgi:phage terminase small subunit
LPFLSGRNGTPAPTNGKGKKLTPKMREFIDLFLIHQNATEAVKLSSYTTKNPTRIGFDLMSHPLVKAEIEKRLNKRAEKAEVTADYLVHELMSIIEETQADNPNACLRAIELAGKSIALWKERQEISGPDGEAIKHEQHIKESVADFTSRISSLAKRGGQTNVVELTKRG